MECTSKEWEHCRVEKMGCKGCHYTTLKEMKYQFDRKIEVLSTGYCLGLLYYILNLGTHPTAYIKIPDNVEIDLAFSLHIQYNLHSVHNPNQ